MFCDQPSHYYPTQGLVRWGFHPLPLPHIECFGGKFYPADCNRWTSQSRQSSGGYTPNTGSTGSRDPWNASDAFVGRYGVQFGGSGVPSRISGGYETVEFVDSTKLKGHIPSAVISFLIGEDSTTYNHTNTAFVPTLTTVLTAGQSKDTVEPITGGLSIKTISIIRFQKQLEMLKIQDGLHWTRELLGMIQDSNGSSGEHSTSDAGYSSNVWY